MRSFWREVLEDERDRFSSTRVLAVSFGLISIFLLIASLLLLPFAKEVSKQCFEAFKYLLGATGPVVLLCGVGQAKSAITNAANAVTQVTVNNVQTDANKRERIAGTQTQTQTQTTTTTPAISGTSAIPTTPAPSAADEPPPKPQAPQQREQ